MFESIAMIGVLGVVGVVIGLAILIAISLRRVVRTNMVHIVQSKSKTTSYGKDQPAGNVYYEWPSWIPVLGVQVIKLPMSNFDLSLQSYNAYDINRVPFVVDVVAFFRIEDTAVAAQRVPDMSELKDQLLQIVQGAVRKVLAADEIDSIMLERAKFGDAFTQEVEDQLQSWGVAPVKAMELMDIRDPNSGESQVIENIMAKQKSKIEMESRTEVAANMQKAETAEIDAQRAVDVREQEAAQAVGERTAEKTRAVGVADEQARQQILTEQKTTKERNMEVVRVEEVKNAEIVRDKDIVDAEAVKQTDILKAEGDLKAEQLKAQGIQAVGEAEAEAKRLDGMAGVAPDIALAEEIGENEGYQEYLVKVRSVEATEQVGVAQAAALEQADIKVIANGGGESSVSLNGVMDLFTSKGGTAVAGALEALAQSEEGAALLNKLKGSSDRPTGWTAE